MNIILPALLHQLHKHNPHRQWTHTQHDTAVTDGTYSHMILHIHETTITLTSLEPPIGFVPEGVGDITETTLTIDLLDPQFLQKLLQDPRLQPKHQQKKTRKLTTNVPLPQTPNKKQQQGDTKK